MDLEKIKWKLLAEEGITKKGNLYRVPECPFIGYNLTETEIKIMRLRYLLNR